MVFLVLKSQPPAHLTFIGLSLILKYESAGISTGTGTRQVFFVIRKGSVYSFLFLINYAKTKTEIVRWLHIGSPL